MKIAGNKVTLKPIDVQDIPVLWELTYGEDHPQWKKWDAPYFPFKIIDFDTFFSQTKEKIEKGEDTRRLGIFVGNELIGTVTYYWEFKATKWLEAGIGIYNPSYWNGGYGTEALSLWVDHLFKTLDIPRVGITTWSGNIRMMKAAEKVGMQLEGRMRKCRYYNGEYYDSIRMGVLREEWEALSAAWA
ncbi:RimJ/RimL family protein N-acetyltransferase [Bacillus pakistanensis]|uniref:RimJ/RimL family protein N-acetyltransferase n=2 Tax=Rossellomorea pakistanensis TaxID=992288 RepID=A0ABS2NJL0_9BACI|nr:GNAT family protein [Bacillus pakistanensis]MBM7588042.1 RimJ/RimL family protein N-acetyltransferase [Bacillus pakistanensis]